MRVQVVVLHDVAGHLAKLAQVPLPAVHTDGTNHVTDSVKTTSTMKKNKKRSLIQILYFDGIGKPVCIMFFFFVLMVEEVI